MAKLREGEKRVQLCFIRPEDVALYDFMEKEAYRCRWPIQTFILASLTEAFKEKMEEYEVEAIAAEAAQKVRERAEVEKILKIEVENVPESMPIEKAAELAIKRTMSMDEAARMANEEIAKLDAVASTMMAKRKLRSGKVPPMPKG